MNTYGLYDLLRLFEWARAAGYSGSARLLKRYRNTRKSGQNARPESD
jgi:hypothetical protein